MAATSVYAADSRTVDQGPDQNLRPPSLSPTPFTPTRKPKQTVRSRTRLIPRLSPDSCRVTLRFRAPCKVIAMYSRYVSDGQSCTPDQLHREDIGEAVDLAGGII